MQAKSIPMKTRIMVLLAICFIADIVLGIFRTMSGNPARSDALGSVQLWILLPIAICIWRLIDLNRKGSAK